MKYRRKVQSMRQQDRRIKRNVAVFKICQIFRSIFLKIIHNGLQPGKLSYNEKLVPVRQ